MTCQDVEKDLVAYVEGDLNDVRREVVRGHAETCPRCGAEVESLRRTLALADAYRIPPLSTGAGVRMLAGVRERVDREGRRRRVFRLVPALGAAAAVLALATIGLRQPRTTAPPPGERVDGRETVAADGAALASEDPEVFDVVLERLATLDVGDPVREASPQRVGVGRTGRRSSHEGEPAVLWLEYQRHLRGAKIEALLRDLSDEEVQQVLRDLQERLTV
jgi:hypothetical protein